MKHVAHKMKMNKKRRMDWNQTVELMDEVRLTRICKNNRPRHKKDERDNKKQMRKARSFSVQG